MCGFVGFTRGEGNLETLNKMTARISHRGPDSAKHHIDDAIALGFRRLSILDLSNAGDQPMSSQNGMVTMMLNGEIYNFQELREGLIQLGYQFKSGTDTEVILHGYMEYGINIVRQLRGMFAICIYDKAKQTLYLARDCFGIKPLYYSHATRDGSFIFGSEIKSFLEHDGFVKAFNDDALRSYLTFQTSALNETFFKGIYKLPPAHILTIQLDRPSKIDLTKYWEIDFKAENRSFEDNVARIKKTMFESVEKHKIADVKVGAFLSGGIDSSYITALLKPNKTFSVGFDQYEAMFDETKNAKRLSELLGIENHAITLSSAQCIDALPDIQYHMDEPHANPSAVPLYFLAQLASQHVTVVLSGEGGDEVFAGYQWYMPSKKTQLYDRLPLGARQAIAKMAKALPNGQLKDALVRGAKPIEARFIGHAIVFSEDEALSILKKPYQKGKTVQSVTMPFYEDIQAASDLDKMQYLDFHVWQPNDILQKADKMSMAHSIELRVPFLDKEVMALAQTLPEAQRVNYQDSKLALRAAALESLPAEWANRPKLGFPVPIKHWIKEDAIYARIKRCFQSDNAKNFFNNAILLQYLEDHKADKVNHARHIWTVYCFLVWYEQYFGTKNRFQ